VTLVGFSAATAAWRGTRISSTCASTWSGAPKRRVPLFGARRADIERFGRRLERLGRARSTIARRLCAVACSYRYA